MLKEICLSSSSFKCKQDIMSSPWNALVLVGAGGKISQEVLQQDMSSLGSGFLFLYLLTRYFTNTFWGTGKLPVTISGVGTSEY